MNITVTAQTLAEGMATAERWALRELGRSPLWSIALEGGAVYGVVLTSRGEALARIRVVPAETPPPPPSMQQPGPAR